MDDPFREEFRSPTGAPSHEKILLRRGAGRPRAPISVFGKTPSVKGGAPLLWNFTVIGVPEPFP